MRWERERNVRELTGCAAKKRGARSSLLHLAGGPLASPAVLCPPHNGKPAALPAGAILDSPQERLPVGLSEASHGQARLSADLERSCLQNGAAGVAHQFAAGHEALCTCVRRGWQQGGV